MKKVFTILTIVALAIIAIPQQSKSQGVITKSMTSSLTNSVDSIRCISNTANYLYISPVQGSYDCAIFQPAITRISAAIGGTIFLQGSVDGTNWWTATYAAGDTVTVADAASQVLKIYVPPTAGLPFKHYRLKCTGASSDTMTVRAKFCGRQ